HHHNNYACRSILIIATVLLPNRLIAQQTEPVAKESSAVRYLVPGPVHEAFVSSAQASQQVGIIHHSPPAEVPAIDRPPQGSPDSVWVDGYWDWNAGLRHYTWIPGCWRRAPHNLRWQAGSWAAAPDGVVRRPGYWYDVHRKPQFMSKAPSVAEDREATQSMLGAGNVWIRGSWTVDDEKQYKWEPGYVAREEAGYQWQAATVLPADGGFVVVPGYWDFPLAGRGTAFAAIQPPLPAVIELRAIDPLSIQRSPNGTWIYYRLLQGSVTAGYTPQPKIVFPSHPPLASQRGLLIDGKATLSGIVRKGDLTPHYIEIKLVGGTARVTETDDHGRFEFAEIPYGRYSILAEGPVQNYHRSGAVIVDIDQPTAQVEIELE
ncbi:MAG: carboxypeptidase regulatory-like domain-containing protein, partial [Planctomycetales bacterium]|nr:carboxypeptidase regulatory-like domain-containing protein [Planctomycetales bacterium]